MTLQSILFPQWAQTTSTKRQALSLWTSVAAAASLFFGVVAASLADGSKVAVDANGISATATVNATSMILRVGGPGGFVNEVRSQGGYVSWNISGGAPEGTYHYDVYATVGSRTDDQDNDAGEMYRESGSFTIRGGAIIPSSGEEAKIPAGFWWNLNQALTRVAQSILDTLVPTAEAQDLTASSTDPSVFYDDTDNGAGNEWQLFAGNAGGSPPNSPFFILRDLVGVGDPIDIRSSANNDNSLVVDDNGDVTLANGAAFINRSGSLVGIGTVTPATALHVMGGERIRVENAGSTWDWWSGSSGLWFQEGGDTGPIPLKFDNGAPDDSLVLQSSGNVGMGTASPSAPLHVRRSSGGALNMFQLTNDGPIGFNMENTSIAQIWRFAAQTTGFRVSLDGTGGPEMEVGNGGTLQVGPGGLGNLFLDGSGNLSIAGSLTQGSDRNSKTAVTDLNGPEVLTKLTALSVSQWAYKSEPTVTHIGPMAQDFHTAFGLGADDKHIAPGDLASVAVVGVKELHKMLAARDAEIAKREAEIAALKRRLAAVEAREERLQALEVAVERLLAVIPADRVTTAALH